MDDVTADLHAAAEDAERALGRHLSDGLDPSDRSSPAGNENRFPGPLGLPQKGDALGFELGDDHSLHAESMTWSCDLVNWMPPKMKRLNRESRSLVRRVRRCRYNENVMDEQVFEVPQGAADTSVFDWQALPGGELIRQGLNDLAASTETVPSLLVSIGAPRLRRLGIEVPDPAFDEPEHRLYRRLARENPDSAHSRYNALIRRLVSFERCAA